MSASTRDLGTCPRDRDSGPGQSRVRKIARTRGASESGSYMVGSPPGTHHGWTRSGTTERRSGTRSAHLLGKFAWKCRPNSGEIAPERLDSRLETARILVRDMAGRVRRRRHCNLSQSKVHSLSTGSILRVVLCASSAAMPMTYVDCAQGCSVSFRLRLANRRGRDCARVEFRQLES
jgi:hypothetical protein